jgi:hypothetical protein
MSEPVVGSATDASTSVIANADPEFAWSDVGMVVLVVLVALVFLYRRLWQKRGACSECGSKDGHCKVKAHGEHVDVPEVPVDQMGGKSS